MNDSLFKRINFRRGLSISMLGFCLSFMLIAQERFGEILGTATDSSGAVLPNVAVKLTNTNTQRALETSTGSNGDYAFRNLEPGKYTVRFAVKGFSTYEVAGVDLSVGKTLRVNAPMAVAANEQSVIVTDSAPLIDTTNTMMANNISADQFDRLPKARSFQNLAVMSTSVNAGALEGGIQVNGASGAENNFTVDGISTTSLINGQSRQDAAFEILQEVQVKTGGISAEWGGAMGGVISAITRSGGNQFHGDVHYYLSGNMLNASPVKRLLQSPTDQITTKYHQDVKQKNDINEIGYALGGYLVKNRLYFFSAASPRFGRRTNDYKFSNGTESDSLSQESTNHMVFEKLSFDITKNLRGNAFFLWTPTKSTGRLPGYNGECPNCNTTSKSASQVNREIGYFAPQTNYGVDLTWMATPTTLLMFKGGRFWDNYKDTGLPFMTPINYSTTATGLSFTPSIPSAQVGAVGFNNTPRIQQSFYDIATRTYVQGDFGKFFNFMGTHDLKLGAGSQKIVNKVLTGYPTGGYINIFWDRAFNSLVPGVPAAQRGAYGYYEFHEFGTEGSTGANLGNIYIQDNWRIHPRLTLNLGFRWEKETVPSFQRNVQDTAFAFNWNDKFAPRLGASFDVFGDGRMKIYGSWGRYYDWVKYELARGTFGGDYWRVRYYALETTNAFGLSSTNLTGRPLWNPAQPTAFRNRRVAGFDTIDPQIKPMGSDNINAGTEFRLGPQMVFRASYVRNRLIRTIEDLGALVNGDEVYYYANPGEGGALMTPTSGLTKSFPTPKATRTYDAAEFQLTRRFSNNWFATASYVYSRLYGNYAGLANSDEIVSTAAGGGIYGAAQEAFGQVSRPGGNANRSWDIDELLWDSKGNLNPQGRLATDRPHAIKLFGSKTFNWGSRHATDAGAFFYGASGTPLTTLINTNNGTQPFVNGRGDLGRTPFLTQTNLVVGHEVKFGEVKRMRFEFNITNLFNQKTARGYWTQVNRAIASAEPSLANIDLAKGYDYMALINGTPDAAKGLALSPLFKQADLFNPGFQGRLMVKFIF